MKLKISREKLSVSLQKVNSIISTRSTLQILGNVLLEAEDNKLILSTTDLDIRIKTEIEAEVFEKGKTTLPARKFYEKMGFEEESREKEEFMSTIYLWKNL